MGHCILVSAFASLQVLVPRSPLQRPSRQTSTELILFFPWFRSQQCVCSYWFLRLLIQFSHFPWERELWTTKLRVRLRIHPASNTKTLRVSWHVGKDRNRERKLALCRRPRPFRLRRPAAGGGARRPLSPPPLCCPARPAAPAAVRGAVYAEQLSSPAAARPGPELPAADPWTAALSRPPHEAVGRVRSGRARCGQGNPVRAHCRGEAVREGVGELRGWAGPGQRELPRWLPRPPPWAADYESRRPPRAGAEGRRVCGRAPRCPLCSRAPLLPLPGPGSSFLARSRPVSPRLIRLEEPNPDLVVVKLPEPCEPRC